MFPHRDRSRGCARFGRLFRQERTGPNRSSAAAPPPVKELLPDTPAPANCYIVSGPGIYKIPAQKGNGEKVAGAAEATWVWTTAENLIDRTSVRYYPESDSISFQVTEPFSPGSAVVALCDESKTILWSWHIWAVEDVNLDAAPGEFMNRNLGAPESVPGSAETYGMYYSYNRKDPIIGCSRFDITVEEMGSGELVPFRSATIPTWVNSDYFGDGIGWEVVISDEFGSEDGHEKMAAYPTKLIGGDYLNVPPLDDFTWSRKSNPCPGGWYLPSIFRLADMFQVEGVTEDNWFWSITVEVPSAFDSDKQGWVSPDGTFWPAAGGRDFYSHSDGRPAGGVFGWSDGGHYWACEAWDEEETMNYKQGARIGYYGDLVAVVPEIWGMAYSVRCVKE